jgi:hypothetical protein
MPSVELTGGSPEARFLTLFFFTTRFKKQKNNAEGQAPQKGEK